VKFKYELITGGGQRQVLSLGLQALLDEIHPNFSLFCRINRVVFYCECSHLFEVLIHNSNLKHFKFTHISLSRSDVKLLGDTLKHPECNIERLQ
jgi:hypothetical protein